MRACWTTTCPDKCATQRGKTLSSSFVFRDSVNVLWKQLVALKTEHCRAPQETLRRTVNQLHDFMICTTSRSGTRPACKEVGTVTSLQLMPSKELDNRAPASAQVCDTLDRLHKRQSEYGQQVLFSRATTSLAPQGAFRGAGHLCQLVDRSLGALWSSVFMNRLACQLDPYFLAFMPNISVLKPGHLCPNRLHLS